MCSCTTSPASTSFAAEGTSYQVAGMTCDSCATKVATAVQALPAVKAVDIDIATGRLTVTGDARGEDVNAAVKAVGYDIRLTNPLDEKPLDKR